MSDSCLIDDRFREQAEKMRDMLRERAQAARDYVTEKLGFNGWSRDLHDHTECYAFLIPKEQFKRWSLVGQLKEFIEQVFYAHFLTVEESEIIEDRSSDMYIVDWCGSRCRHVELGPHIYFRVGFDGWVSDRIKDDPVVPEDLNGLSWTIETDCPSQYETKQWASVTPHRSQEEKS